MKDFRYVHIYKIKSVIKQFDCTELMSEIHIDNLQFVYNFCTTHDQSITGMMIA